MSTDFIFAAVAEELGLVGAFALLALALALVFRGLRIAMLARDDFSAMLAVGLTASLGLQTLIIVSWQPEADPAHRHHLPIRQLRRIEPAGQLPGDRLAALDQPSRRDRGGRGAAAVIATNVRRLAVYLVLSFAIVSGGLRGGR